MLMTYVDDWYYVDDDDWFTLMMMHDILIIETHGEEEDKNPRRKHTVKTKICKNPQRKPRSAQRGRQKPKSGKEK